MPEIAEVARVVHFLKLHLVGKRVLKVSAQDDASVFGKAGTSGAEFAAALKGKKVVSAGSQGKYFWLVLDKPPHPVMHLGMTGWVHIKGVRSAYTNYYKKMKPGEEDVWPPKFWKFQLETDDGSGGSEAASIAYTDPRRFGRVRLVDCPGAEIRSFSPLAENGPDPVVDAEVFTLDYLTSKMRARHVPVKALLLDQTMISGIGNWVGDEVLYHARLHPEQYSNEFGDAEIERLHKAIVDVCGTAVGKLGDSDQFPDDWLFNYRWGKGKGEKGKGDGGKLPNGQKLAFITVGGRTSCYAPALQKKSGSVAPGIKEEPLAAADAEEGDGDANGVVKTKGKRAAATATGTTTSRKQKKPKVEEEDEVDEEDEDEDDEEPAPKRSRGGKSKKSATTTKAPLSTPQSKAKLPTTTKAKEEAPTENSAPRRRSGRIVRSS